MQSVKIWILSLLLLAGAGLHAQGYKVGDQLEAYLNNGWTKVTITKVVVGKTVSYQVRTVGAVMAMVGSDKLRTVKVAVAGPQVNSVNGANVTAEKTSALTLGRYELYGGVQHIYIGHMVLLADGKYKIAFDTDEDNYDELGRYVYHAQTGTIEWLAGMCKTNNWGGKIIRKEGSNTVRIEFTPTSYAEHQ